MVIGLLLMWIAAQSVMAVFVAWLYWTGWLMGDTYFVWRARDAD